MNTCAFIVIGTKNLFELCLRVKHLRSSVDAQNRRYCGGFLRFEVLNNLQEAWKLYSCKYEKVAVV